MFIAYFTKISFVGRGGLVCFETLSHRVLGASTHFGRRLGCDTWHSVEGNFKKLTQQFVLSASERLISSCGLRDKVEEA